MTTPATPIKLHADERRSVTVEAVIALAGAQDPSTITTAAIAKHMNVTQGALFRHFPNKDSIWKTVMEWVTQRLLDRIDQAAKTIESPLQALQAMFLSHIDFVAEHPGVPRMMFGQLQSPEETAAKQIAHSLMQRYAERVERRIEQGKTDGSISTEVDSRAAAVLFIGTVQGLVMQSLLSNNLDGMRQQAPLVYAIYQRGMRTSP